MTKTPSEQLAAYAAVAWEPEDLIEIRPLPPWGGSQAWIKANELASLSDKLQTISDRGTNIYAGICPRNKIGGSKAIDVDGGRVIWLDFDDCPPEHALKICGDISLPPPSMAVMSGHGCHLFWRLDSWTPKAELSRVIIDLISLLQTIPNSHIDKGASDPPRILRLPGFINHKAPKALAHIVFDSSTRYPISLFDSFLASKIKPIPQAIAETADTQNARKYPAKIPGSSKGGRTNTAFKVACVLVNDKCLSDADALGLLIEWDAYSNAPSIASDYGMEEFSKIIQNAHRYAKQPKGNKAKKQHSIRDIDVDLSGILSKIKPTTIPEKFLNVPGFIGEVMAHNLATAHKPQPALALAGALALQAILCAGKLTDTKRTRPNVYISGVAESGEGKDWAKKLNKEILLRAGLSHLQAEGIKSGSGLVNALVRHPQLLFHIDEYGRYIKSAANQEKNPHIYDVVSKLLILYSSSDSVFESDRYADADKGGKQIRNPHAIIYGITVPRSLYEGLTGESVTDGFLARSLIFEISEKVKRRIVSHADIPESIIDQAKAWGDWRPGGSGNLGTEPFIMEYTSGASEIEVDFLQTENDEIEHLKDDPCATLWTRTAENAAKLSMLFAASRGQSDLRLDSEAVQWGYGLSEWLTRRMVEIVQGNVGDNPHHQAGLKILKIVKARHGRISRRELLKKMNMDAIIFDRVMNTLIERGDLVSVQTPTAGRTRTDYALESLLEPD